MYTLRNDFLLDSEVQPIITALSVPEEGRAQVWVLPGQTERDLGTKSDKLDLVRSSEVQSQNLSPSSTENKKSASQETLILKLCVNMKIVYIF